MRRRDFFKVCGGAVAVLAVAPTLMGGNVTAPNYPLGKLSAAEPRLRLPFKRYADLSKLPTPPAEFGHEGLVPNWGDLGNQSVGDCAIAGPLHSLMLWNAEAGTPFPVDTACALRNYSTLTGYDPHGTNVFGVNPTDKGTIAANMVEYWRTTGFLDSTGKAHKIDAYLSLTPGDIDELWAALYLFDGVGLGIQFPVAWMKDFTNGVTWDKVDSPNAGGHYVTATGRRNGCINVVSWGKNQLMTPAGYAEFSDETYVFFDSERFKNGKDVDGFDYGTLLKDLAVLAG